MSLFVTFEGPEGSGKSTQIQLLAEHLRALGHDVLLTREPGGTEIGDQIRDVLHDLKNKAMHPRAELLLYAASRAQLVAEVIRPQLARGGIVLSDRYADSTLAYQGYGHQLDLEALRGVVKLATAELAPDLTFLLDIESQRGLSRRQTSGGEWNRLDAYPLAFHRRVREGYFTLAQAEPERWVTLDASLEVDEIQGQIRAEVERRMKKPVFSTAG